MRVTAQIKPNSRKGPLVETNDDGGLIVYVRAPATEGKANAEAIAVIANHFGVSRSQVQLVAGATSRFKRFEIG